MAFKLDEVDIQLLNALQADADRTNLELARLVGLSPAATLHRVRALKESGVIRIIRADVDPAAAGFPLRVFVAAAMGRHDPRATAAFEDHIRSVPQIIAADNVAGETDYLLSVVARDVEELQHVLAGLSARGRYPAGDVPAAGGDQAVVAAAAGRDRHHRSSRAPPGQEERRPRSRPLSGHSSRAR